MLSLSAAQGLRGTKSSQVASRARLGPLGSDHATQLMIRSIEASSKAHPSASQPPPEQQRQAANLYYQRSGSRREVWKTRRTSTTSPRTR